MSLRLTSWCEVGSCSEFYYLLTSFPLLSGLAIVYDGQNILHCLWTQPCDLLWWMECEQMPHLTRDFKRAVLYSLPVGSLLATRQVHVPGSHCSFSLVQRMTNTWSRSASELIHVIADCRPVWEINVFCCKPTKFGDVCYAASLQKHGWLTQDLIYFWLETQCTDSYTLRVN